MQRVPPYGGFRLPENTGLVQVRIADALALPLIGGRIADRKYRCTGSPYGTHVAPALRKEQATRQGQQYEKQFAHKLLRRIRSDAKLHFFPEKSAALGGKVHKRAKITDSPPGS